MEINRKIMKCGRKKGYKHTEEARRKMSEAKKGKTNPEHSKRMSGENNPMKRSEVRTKFQGENHPFYGKRHSEENKIKISQNHADISGKNHPQWKGGISAEPYCLEFRCKEWREIIYERDNDKFCWNPQCEERGNKETLHHIDYDKKNCHPSNIIKICNSCNSQANFNREWWQSFYNAVMQWRN